MRIGFSWPLGRGQRMWISGGPLFWLCFVYIYLAAYIVVGAAWVIVAIVQLAYYGVRAIVRAIRNRRQ